MKEYFLRLLDYDKYANDVILGALLEAKEPELPVQLMAHLLSAQQVWYNRCKNIPPTVVVLWLDWKAGSLRQIINDNNTVWADFLNTCEPGDFEQIITYTDTRGNAHSNTLSDILTHMFNHGTHHRAQIGQHLRPAGLEKLPMTDYIFYVRTK